MFNSDLRKLRLHRLIDIARAYRNVTKAQLAEILERDPSRLYPDTDNPKLDLLVSLARVLEWSVDAVIEYIWDGEPGAAAHTNGCTFEAALKLTLEAHQAGRFNEMIEHARKMLQVAGSAAQRGKALRLEAAGWEGLGRYPQALAVLRRGLQQAGLPADERIALQGNLGHAYYCLWDLTSAMGATQVVLSHFAARPAATRAQRGAEAFAYYVRGNVQRRMLTLEPEDRVEIAKAGRADLEKAAERYAQLAADFDAEYLRGIANTCRGGILELDVEIGAVEPEAAIEQVLKTLEAVADEKQWPSGDWLESYGWWCDFGANIARRRLIGRRQHQVLAILSGKLTDIARRLDNWALLERVVAMQHALNQQLSDSTGINWEYTIDLDELRLITGAMGRFPELRQIGWNLIDRAAMVQGLGRN